MPQPLPMDALTIKQVECQMGRGDFGSVWEMQPSRSYWTFPSLLAEARVTLWASGVSRPDDEFSAELDPDELRQLAAMFAAWADACDDERKARVARPW